MVQTERVPLSMLPDHYAQRLDQTRRKQGVSELFAEDQSVPLRWIILDLHTGDFFGKYGPLVYDLLAVIMVVLGTTGVYMYFKIRQKSAF